MWKIQKSNITGEVICVFKVDESGAYVSVSLDNPEYLKWLADGNTPDPADELPQE